MTVFEGNDFLLCFDDGLVFAERHFGQCRDGLPSTAWLAYGLQDVVQQRKMIASSDGDDAYRRQLTAHLDAMLALCETVECRRVQLLNYFGQPGEPCGNCDTCLNPPQSWDGTVPAQKLLSTVYRLKSERRQRFGAGQSIDILLGKQTPKVTQFSHDQLSVFGIGTELSEGEWRGVVRQLLAQGLLMVEGDYSTLALTQDSGAVLRGDRKVLMRREPERPARAPKQSAAGAARRGRGAERGGQAGLREAARLAWRRWPRSRASRRTSIFHDATLRQIATQAPTSLQPARHDQRSRREQARQVRAADPGRARRDPRPARPPGSRRAARRTRLRGAPGGVPRGLPRRLLPGVTAP